MNPKQLMLLCRSCSRAFHNGEYAERCAWLLAGTAATESHLKYRRQVGFSWQSEKGAFGLWQIEKGSVQTSLNWLQRNIKRKNQALFWLYEMEGADFRNLNALGAAGICRQMTYDHKLACLFARVHYLQKPGKVPSSIAEQASYYKKHFNTYLGKGSEEKYMEDFRRLIEFNL